MEKIHDSVTKRLPPLRLYLDELRELHNFVSSCCKEPVIIETCGYRLKSLDEVSNLTENTTNSILFSSQQPYLQVRLTSVYGEIYIGDGGIEAEGIASRVESILLRGKVSRPLLLDRVWVSVALGVSLWMGVIITNPLIITLSVALMLIAFLWIIWDYRFVTQHYNTLVFRMRKDSPNFWTRNKDQIILLLIGAVIGAVITVVVAK